MCFDTIPKIDVVAVHFFSEGMEVVVITSDLQKFGNSFLVDRWLRYSLNQPLCQDLFFIYAGVYPSDPETRCQHFSDRAAPHYQSLFIIIVTRFGPGRAEIDIAIEVILDQWNMVQGQKFDKLAFVFVRHECSQRITEIGNKTADI